MTSRYSVKVGDEVLDFEGPDNLTDQQITDLTDKYLRKAKPGQKLPHSVFTGQGSYDPEHPKNDNSTLGSFMRGGVQGLSSWTDEAAAAGNAAIPGLAELEGLVGTNHDQVGPGSGGDFQSRYEHNMGDIHSQLKADEEAHPTAHQLGEVAGVASTLLPAAKVFKALPEVVQGVAAARPYTTAALAGLTTGAVQGAGAGEGNRAQSAALGGLTGAAMAFGLTGAINFAPKVAQYAKLLFKHGATESALNQMRSALMRDGFDVSTPAGSQALQAELDRYGSKPVSLADIGQSSRARTGVGLRSPSNVQQQSIDIVGSRQAGQGQRLASDIRANVAPRTDVHALDEALVQQRADQAEPLREKALFDQAPTETPPQQTQVIPAPDTPDAGVRRTLGQEVPETYQRQPITNEELLPATTRKSRVVDDPELQNLARLPLAQRALGAALDQAEAERGLLATTGKSIEHLPDLNRGSQLDMRTMDYLKRYLDDEVTRLYKRGDTSTFSAQQANQVKALRDAIRERLRKVNQDYADYLDAYKGSSEMIDALDEGRKFDQLDPEQINMEQGGRSKAAQELYRVGTARSLLDKVRSAKDGAVPARRILNSDESRAQLAATGVTPNAMKRINQAVEQERTLSLLGDELKGSQTDARRLASDDADHAVHMPILFNPGSPISWVRAGTNAILNHGLPARNALVNETLLPRMLETNPEGVKKVIAELEQHGNIAQARKLRRALIARQTATGNARTIGSMVALPNIGDDSNDY